MNVLIAGGTGYIGQHLAPFLIKKGHTVTILSRSNVDAITWENLNSVNDYDVVINLCGASIGAKRWSAQRKQEIIESRIQPTERLAALCYKAGTRLLNANAIGIYGLDGTFTEESPIDFTSAPDFLAKVGREWELATRAAKNVVIMRFGVVLSYDGGALKQLKLPYLCGMGGKIGDGQQPFAWVSLLDLLEAIAFLIDHPEIEGPVNIVSPTKNTQKEFATALGHALKRPTFMTTPAWLIKLIFQQMGEELLLRGQFVTPKRLLDLGFTFKNPTLGEALWYNKK